MSYDPSQLSQLISQLIRGIQHGQTPQILSISGPTNQTLLQPNQGALSSGSPNVAHTTIQVMNSNMNYASYNFHLGIGNSNLGAGAIDNGDHGEHPNHQDSRPTVISYASQSTSRATEFIGSNSVQSIQSSDLSADQADVNAKLVVVEESTVDVEKSTADLDGSTVELAELFAKLNELITALHQTAVEVGGSAADLNVELADLPAKIKESITALHWLTVEVGKSTVELDGSAVEFAEVTTKLSESVTALDSSTFKLSIDELAVESVDAAVQLCMSILRISGVVTRFSRSVPAEFSKTTVQLDEGLTAVSDLDSPHLFNDFKAGEQTTDVRTDCIRRLKAIASLIKQTIELNECSHWVEKLSSPLREFVGPVVELVAFEEIAIKLRESANTFSKSLTTFGESLIPYSKSLAALDDLLAAFSRQASDSDL